MMYCRARRCRMRQSMLVSLGVPVHMRLIDDTNCITAQQAMEQFTIEKVG
jgi:hypothetical protein